MAKGGRDYAAEYKRRQERGEARGLTRQQARGHKPREHVARAEREIEERGISNAQERTVRRWGEARRDGGRGFAKNKDLDPQQLVEWTASHGYAAFRALRWQQELRHRQWVRDGRPYNKKKGAAGVGAAGLVGGYGMAGATSGPAAFGGGLADEAADEFDQEYFDWDFDTDDLDIGWLYYH